MKIDESIFDESDFKRWLEEKRPVEVVGFAGNPGFCPLAKWICSKGSFSVDVCAGFAEIADGSYPMFTPKLYFIKLPDWATDFVCRIDDLANARRSAGRLSSRQITRDDALTVLKFLRPQLFTEYPIL